MSSIIRPEDFNRSTKDPNRHLWQIGQMRHVMAAIKASGANTIFETMRGLLQEYQPIGLLPYKGVLLRRTWTENGKEGHQDTWFPLYNLGAIIVMESSFGDTRHRAIQSYGEESGKLVQVAQAAHGVNEGRAWGSWKANPGCMDGTGYVTYEPHTGNPAFADRWGTYWSGDVHI